MKLIPPASSTRRAFLRGGVAALVGAVAPRAYGNPQLTTEECEDCLNRDLSTAAGDALVLAKHNGGHARVRYITLYAVPKERRIEYMAGISVLCHQLSHAGVTIRPQKISDSVWRLDLDQYDPHNVGWEQGWEEIVAHDLRYHYGDLVPGDRYTTGRVFVGSTVEVKCSDGKFYPAKVVQLDGAGYFFEINGRQFHSAKNTIREPQVAAVHHGLQLGDWVDYSAAKLLREITGSDGAILDGREFAHYASRTSTYYTFRNSPKTLNEWLKSWGEFEANGFGKLGVRGANIETSNVTFVERGLERRRLAVWLTFDRDKDLHDLTADRDPFNLPDRSHKIDATEAFALMPNGGMDCFIANGDGLRADFVPSGVAIDTSHGTRTLKPGLSCWTCHTEPIGDELPSGFLAWEDSQTTTRDFTKDPKLAAELSAYYGNQAQLEADAERDREIFERGCREASGGLNSAQAFGIINHLAAEVELSPVDPARACREFCLPTDGDPKETLARWLNGTTNKHLQRLFQGGSVNYSLFRLTFNESLHAIHQRRNFSK